MEEPSAAPSRASRRSQAKCLKCGRSSEVERQLPKLNVVGSIPIARSKLPKTYAAPILRDTDPFFTGDANLLRSLCWHRLHALTAWPSGEGHRPLCPLGGQGHADAFSARSSRLRFRAGRSCRRPASAPRLAYRREETEVPPIRAEAVDEGACGPATILDEHGCWSPASIRECFGHRPQLDPVDPGTL